MGRDEVDHKIYIMMSKFHDSSRTSTLDRNEFWNFYPTLKEACKLFWMEKGHFEVTLETVLASQNGYFKRAWYNEEAYVHIEGFEEAFFKFIEKNYVHSD